MLPLTDSIALLAVPLLGGGLGKLIVSSLKRKYELADDAPEKATASKQSADTPLAKRTAGVTVQVVTPNDPEAPRVVLDVVMLRRKNRVAEVHREFTHPVSDAEVRSALDSLNKQVPG